MDFYTPKNLILKPFGWIFHVTAKAVIHPSNLTYLLKNILLQSV